MLKNIFYPLFVLAIFLNNPAFAAPLGPDFEAYVQDTMTEFNVPGLAIAVLNDKGVVWSKGFGYRDMENKLPVTTDTLFAIGSTTKAMTATGVGILVDRQQVDFDQPVLKYLPDFQLHDPAATQLATPRDLLGHMTGLPRHDFLWYGSGLSRQELYSRLPHLELSASFRQKWQYQNLMFMVAGILVEQQTGSSWEEFTQREIFDPLGMVRTNFSVATTSKDPDHSKAYKGDRHNPAQLIPFRDIGAIGPAGSVNSSVNEMAQWLRLQLLGGEVDGKKLVSPEVLKEIHLPRNFITDAFRPSYPEFTDLHYGMGWMVSYYQGTKIVFHNGGIDGFITHVSFLPEKNLAVVAFANNGSFNSRALALKAYDTLLDFPTKDWVAVMNPKSPAPPPLPATKPLERPGQDYVGTYFHPGYGEITIGEEDGSITIKFTVFDSKLIHLGQGQFINEGLRENFPISFEFDSSGAASQLLWLLEPSLGKAIVFDRL